MTIKIVFLDSATIGPQIKRQQPSFEHIWTEYRHTDPEQVVERLTDADICVTNKVPLRRQDLERLPQLRYIVVCATGTNIIDIEYCKARGLPVSNVVGYAKTTVTEYVFAAIGALNRKFAAYKKSLEAGRWQESEQFCFFDHPIADLANKCLVIVGGGNIGSAVGKLGEAYGMRVAYSLRKGHSTVPRARDGKQYVPFEECVREADVISLHCPLTPETRHLIAKTEFDNMKNDALLINTGRGGLVHEKDLTQALRSGSIGGAAFDVVTTEPPDPRHPFYAILDMPNFILTPHVAWSSLEAMTQLWEQVVDSLESFVQGVIKRRVA